jgi:hypothetical protein
MIEGVETDLWACHSHEEWLRDYVQEDAAVLLVEEDGRRRARLSDEATSGSRVGRSE